MNSIEQDRDILANAPKDTTNITCDGLFLSEIKGVIHYWTGSGNGWHFFNRYKKFGIRSIDDIRERVRLHDENVALREQLASAKANSSDEFIKFLKESEYFSGIEKLQLHALNIKFKQTNTTENGEG